MREEFQKEKKESLSRRLLFQLNESDSLFIALASLLLALNQDFSLSANLQMDQFLAIGLNIYKSVS